MSRMRMREDGEVVQVHAFISSRRHSRCSSAATVQLPPLASCPKSCPLQLCSAPLVSTPGNDIRNSTPIKQTRTPVIALSP